MSWSDNENGRFEQALADIEADHPGRWQLVAEAVGGGRTADDVWRHYLKLEGDTADMGASNRAARRRQQYRRNRGQQQQQHQHGADANGTAANNSRSNDRRRRNGGGASSSNSNNNSRANNNRYVRLYGCQLIN
ncbi:unnamed protein product [Miscanthus lutarioriparius]|uniref:Myb-like domain-containing protein n=1 Tax=Miscanthus lutarioriparius TaxID=422564 RepID=A0A811RYS0_9POAL|nr:unnamed protein product [Miscanthus lutarioriparius]